MRPLSPLIATGMPALYDCYAPLLATFMGLFFSKYDGYMAIWEDDFLLITITLVKLLEKEKIWKDFLTKQMFGQTGSC